MGSPADRITFLFLTPNGPVELDLDDLAEAVADVRTLVGAGLAGGTVNAVVGSGTLIVFPVLLAVGFYFLWTF